MNLPIILNRENLTLDASLLPPIEPPRSPIRELLRVLRRNVWLIALCTLLTVVAGAAIIFSLTPTYTATATVILSQSANDPLASPDAQAPRPDESAPETIAVMFKSHDLARKAVEAIDYAAAPKPPPKWRVMLCRTLPASFVETICDQPGVAPLPDRVDAFLGHLAVDTVGRSRALTLTFIDENAAEATRALDTLIGIEASLEQDLQGAQLDRTARWLEARAGELQQRWLQAENKVTAFRTGNGLTQIGSGGGLQPLILQQIGDATTALSQAQAALAAAAARASVLQLASSTVDKRSLLRMTEQPVISAAAVSLNDLYVQRARLRDQYGAGYPLVTGLSRQIEQAEVTLNAQIDGSLQTVRSEVAEKQAQVASLQNSLNALRQQFGSSSSKESQATSLEGEAKAAQLSYQAFLTQSQRFIGRSDIQQPITSVVSYAHAQDRPTFPRKGRLLTACALFGVVLGIGAAMAREHLHAGFTEISRVGSALSLTLLATIETVSPGTLRNRAAAVARYVTRRPHSAAAESARSIAASIALLRKDANASQAVSIVSVTSNEGKSTVAVWLASVAVGPHNRVLVIDCDNRAGTLAGTMNGRHTPSMADVLNGTATFADAIQSDRESGIDYIAAGPMSVLDGRMDLDQLRFKLVELKQTYKLVLLDTPPLLASSDALLLSRVVDHTLLVCRWRSTSREAVLEAIDRLRSTNAQVIGVVLSFVNARQRRLFSDTLRRRDQVMLKRYYGN